jgi:hypothetical protein
MSFRCAVADSKKPWHAGCFGFNEAGAGFGAFNSPPGHAAEIFHEALIEKHKALTAERAKGPEIAKKAIKDTCAKANKRSAEVRQVRKWHAPADRLAKSIRAEEEGLSPEDLATGIRKLWDKSAIKKPGHSTLTKRLCKKSACK